MKTLITISMAIYLFSFGRPVYSQEVTSVCKQTVYIQSPFFQALFLLFERVGEPIDLMGTTAVEDEQLITMNNIISPLNKEELGLLASMAKIKCLSDYNEPAIDRNLQLQRYNDVKILGKNHEKALRKLISEKINP